MQTITEIKYESDIKERDRKIVYEILLHYDFYVYSVEKARSAFKINTDKGAFCLKGVSHGYRKAKKSYSLMKYLKDKGYNNIAEYYYTKEGKAIIRNGDTAFYITYWIEGCEVSFGSSDEILKCSELLASFHNNAKGFTEEKHIHIKNNTKKWGRVFAKCRKELGEFKKHIDRLQLKAEFDYEYRSHIDYFRKEGDKALKILESSGYNELCDYYIKEAYICHDSYYYQNIIKDINGKLYIVDLESCQFDMPMSDLGKYIRRILSKKSYKWDLDLCRRIIESYCKVRPMTKEEYTLLLAMMVFPHKFWKLGKKRYIREKKWNEAKYKKKLHRLIREKQYKEEFIDSYIKFYGIDMFSNTGGENEGIN